MTSTSTKSKVLCCFCGIGNERELELGKLYTEENITVHYYCLLFSSALPQNGDDEEGIMGFLPKDLEKEIQRGRKLSCCYCCKRGATIGCSERKCRKTYHYPCGIEHHALFKFTNDFRSYCSQHRTFQKGKGAGEEVQCPICLEELIADPKTAVWAPCCKKNFWFHKLCLQRLALSAGYFFKCPLCNDKEQFAFAMQNVGIYIPEKDASWELEPNAYSELLERPIHCDAPKCRCPDGRKIDNDGSRWEILLCNLCGSTGVHVACGGLSFSCVEWTCPVCASMVAESVKRTQQETREKRLKERKDKIGHSSGEDESTSYETALCMMSSSSESHSVKCSDGSTDVRDIHQTPCKRKLEVQDSIEETPSKFFSIDEGCVLKLTGNGDSDDEIDVESGECQVPPHTIIRELEEHGEELPKLLTKVKNSAVRAQERMSELRLTEIEIVKMAKEFSQFKAFPLDKSDIIRFYRYSLPFEKMLFILKLIKVIFALREAAVEEVHSSGKKQKKAKGSTPGRRSRRLNSPKTPNIKIPFLKNALKQTVIAARRSPRSVEKLEIEDHENSTEIDCGYLHAVKTKLYSSLDHENGASEKFKEDKSIADLNSAAFCAVSPIQPSVAPETVEKPGISESTDTHRRETGFKFSPEGEVGPAASSLSERLSTKDEMMTDQGIVDKENTYSSQKNNNDIKDQEANTVGACRKLSLVCAAHDGEPEDYDDPGAAALVSAVMKIKRTKNRRTYPGHTSKIGAGDKFSLLNIVKDLRYQELSKKTKLCDFSQIQAGVLNKEKVSESSEGDVRPGVLINFDDLKAVEESIKQCNLRNNYKIGLFEYHPSILKTWEFQKFMLKNMNNFINAEMRAKHDEPVLSEPTECSRSIRVRNFGIEDGSETKVTTENINTMWMNMIPCDWGMYTLKQPEYSESRSTSTDTNDFEVDKGNISQPNSALQLAQKCQPCVVVLERLPLPAGTLKRAPKFGIVTDNIIEVLSKPCQKINIITPRLLKKRYLFASSHYRTVSKQGPV